MRWLAKTFTGLLLAIAVLSVGGYFALNYAITQFTKLPPKPTFPNDNPNYVKKNKSKSNDKNLTLPKDAPVKEKDKEKEEPKPKPLPAGAFEGRVTFTQGLVLRDAAGRDSGTIGGLEYNESLTVLETSSDGEWQKVRTSKNKEGWVRGGNIQKN
jgi:Bacterial SH3 domain